MIEYGEDIEYDPYDPPRVSWQRQSLYRVEYARRALRAARQRAAEHWEWQRRYDEDTRRLHEERARREVEQKAAWAEHLRRQAELEAERRAEREKAYAEDMARRRHRLPAWAEWAAWQAVVSKRTQRALGEELGGVAGSVIGQGIEDYVYVNYPEIARCPVVERRRWLRRYFAGKAEPVFPGRVVRLEEGPPKRYPQTPEEFRARNEWIYRQRLGGRTLRDIASMLDMTRSAIDVICKKQAEIDLRRKEKWPRPKPWRAQRNLGRPIDMGGPRDVWLSYELGGPQ